MGSGWPWRMAHLALDPSLQWQWGHSIHLQGQECRGGAQWYLAPGLSGPTRWVTSQLLVGPLASSSKYRGENTRSCPRYNHATYWIHDSYIACANVGSTCRATQPGKRRWVRGTPNGTLQITFPPTTPPQCKHTCAGIWSEPVLLTLCGPLHQPSRVSGNHKHALWYLCDTLRWHDNQSSIINHQSSSSINQYLYTALHQKFTTRFTTGDHASSTTC